MNYELRLESQYFNRTLLKEKMNIQQIFGAVGLFVLAFFGKKAIGFLFPSTPKPRDQYYEKRNPVSVATSSNNEENRINIFNDVFDVKNHFFVGKGMRRVSGALREEDDEKVRAHQASIYCSRKLRLSSPQGHSDLSSDELFNSMYSDLHGDKSEMIILKGRIGCGKSTLINNHRTKLIEKYRSNVEFNGIYINSYTDLRKLFESEIRPNHSHLTKNSVAQEFEQSLLKKIKYDISHIDNKLAKGVENLANFSQVFEYCNRTNIHLYIFLDELDVLYYEFCKLLTLETNKITMPRQLQVFDEVIKKIWNLSSVSQLKLNGTGVVKIVVAMRTSSYKLFQGLVNEENNLPSEKKKIKEVEVPLANSNDIKSFILLRLECYFKNLTNANEKNSVLNENLNSILKRMQSNEQLSINQTSLILSVHGVRHVFKLLDKIINLDKSGNTLQRALFSDNLFKLFQYTDGSDIYSQTREGVSNIFLINGDYAKDFNDHSLTPIVPDTLLKPHLHTYWLKYLMLLYMHDICHKDHENIFVLSSDVYSIFSGSGRDRTHYEEELITLILFHFAEVRHGRLITVIGRNNNTVELRVTSRVLVMFKNNILTSFVYLMVIIEDEWLQIPYNLRKYIFSEENMSVSALLASFANASDQEILSVIKKKLLEVIVFTEILKYHMRHEKSRYEKSFLNLLSRKIDLKSIVKQLSSSEITSQAQGLYRELTNNRQVKINSISTKFHIFILVAITRLKLWNFNVGYFFTGLKSHKKIMRDYYKNRMQPTAIIQQNVNTTIKSDVSIERD